MQRFARPLRTLLRTTNSRAVSSTTRPIITTPTISTSFLTRKMATSTTAPTGADAFLSFVKSRRTIYALSKDLPIPTSRVQDIVKEALQHVPSSFNSQSNRVLVLLGAEHDKFWDLTTEILKGIVPEANFASTAARMAGFRAGAGTVLFFEDWTVVEGMQEKFALYADRFGPWAGHSNAMLQFAVWTALEAEGLGANLQHYNPLVDEKVQQEWNIPSTWKLSAQLVFGGRAGEPGEKTFEPLETKYKVFGA
ncbi:Nitroreductase-like protein [Triangularia setosa]|uniref:Nitroreductase-like protein n=1 Tax=Triangularia setosa TaxID=2587417 RepID=A0AAN6WBT0_9PEZI|nr:Nitroreductase-like protein [Podospora setosa]